MVFAVPLVNKAKFNLHLATISTKTENILESVTMDSERHFKVGTAWYRTTRRSNAEEHA